MEKVIEDLSRRELLFDVNDIYTATADVAKFIFELGSVKEEKNVYSTDGPDKKTNAVFVFVENFDKTSNIAMTFNVEGVSNDSMREMKIIVESKFVIEFDDSDNVPYEAFKTYYISHIRPKMKIFADRKENEIYEKFASFIKTDFSLSTM